MLVLKNLVIGFRREGRIFSFMFRTDDFSEIIRHFRLVLFRIDDIRVQVEQTADQLAQFLIVIE